MPDETPQQAVERELRAAQAQVREVAETLRAALAEDERPAEQTTAGQTEAEQTTAGQTGAEPTNARQTEAEQTRDEY